MRISLLVNWIFKKTLQLLHFITLINEYKIDSDW